MLPRKRLALTLVAAGALACTTVSAPPSFAADAHEAEAASNTGVSLDAQQTVIVQLEDGADREGVRQRIDQAVAAATPGASTEYVRDYHHVFEGFAVKAPSSALAAIKGVQGVQAVVSDGVREPIVYPEIVGRASDEIDDPSALTHADQASERGQGRVIEVIDSGLDTSHEAFSGALDAASLRVTQADMAALTTQLGAGRAGAWVSDKIPFAYDYADADTNVLADYEYGIEDYTRHVHGTRMAALAGANGTTYRGSAPGAQLIVAKVVSDSWNVVRDSVVLAALDDAMVLKPDALVVSVMAARDVSGDAARLYARAYDKLSAEGVTVDAPAGDDGRAAWSTRGSDPGAIGAPAEYSSVLSVAALSASGAPGQPSFKPWDSSSWGPAPDLRLKPEIAAPGVLVNSAAPGNDYVTMSGTAEASAQVAGAATLVRQRIETDPAFAGMSDGDKSALVTNFLMGTAHPVVDASQANGTFWSPRRVGAGMVDALAATTSPVYPTVVGAANPTRPKADLGDGTDGWSFQVQLTNVSDEARTYTLGGQALSENVIDLLFRANSTNWAGAGIDLTFSADSVTVPAASSATVTVTVTPKAEFASWAKENTPQGTFIDGAVTFTSADGAPDLTVPYLGFYGESDQLGIFDSPVYGESKLSPSTMTFHGLPLGQINPFDPEESMAISTNDRDLYIITRSAEENARTYATPGTVLLRDVDSLTYTYTNEAGDTVRSYTYPGAPRSRTVGSGRFSEVTTAESTFDSAPFFDGYDEAGRELPDGNYTLTIEGTRGGANPATEQLTHVIRLDTQAPTISNVTITGEGDDAALSFDVTDSSPIAGYGFSMAANGEAFMREKEYGWGELGGDGARHYHYDIKLSDIAQRAGADPKAVYLQVWDWPLNRAPLAVSLAADDTPAPKAGEWKHDGRGWWYRYEDGSYPADTAVMIDGTTYRFDASGYMRTGWAFEGGQWFYHASSGAQVSGWVYSGVHWYYMSPATGAMATGWVQVGSTWYYLSPATGAMHSGWLQEGGHWYYLDRSSGAMVTGWVKIYWKWYHFADNGQLID